MRYRCSEFSSRFLCCPKKMRCHRWSDGGVERRSWEVLLFQKKTNKGLLDRNASCASSAGKIYVWLNDMPKQHYFSDVSRTPRTISWAWPAEKGRLLQCLKDSVVLHFANEQITHFLFLLVRVAIFNDTDPVSQLYPTIGRILWIHISDSQPPIWTSWSRVHVSATGVIKVGLPLVFWVKNLVLCIITQHSAIWDESFLRLNRCQFPVVLSIPSTFMLSLCCSKTCNWKPRSREWLEYQLFMPERTISGCLIVYHKNGFYTRIGLEH